MDPKTRKISEHAGIGVATYDLSEIDLPEETVNVPKEKEVKHGVFPIPDEFFGKLHKYSLWDVNQQIKWKEPGSFVIFYMKKKLVGDSKVVTIVRDLVSSRSVDKFLYEIGYFSDPRSELLSTLIVFDQFRRYDPPVPWEAFVRGWRPRTQLIPQSPMSIDEAELSWIKGR